MDENIYIKNLHSGDESIFRSIFEEYHPRLCYFASTLLPSTEAPEDVVQEAFVKLWQRRSHFHDASSIKAFLYITVKNQCLNLCKHQLVVRKYNFLSHTESSDEVIGDSIIESEVLENVYRALGKLPAGCRQVVQLSYFKGLKNKDIARQLNVSINTVKTQKKRALHLLRTVLKATSLWIVFFAVIYFL